MKKVFSVLASTLMLGAPAFASPLGEISSTGINAVATNQANNTQSAIGTVNQSPIGGVNSNYQINNSQATDYGFAPGIYCRGANFSIGGYGGGANADGYGRSTNASDYGGIAMFTIPIGGDVMSSCKALAKEIVKQRQLDTVYNMIKVCGAMKKEKISVDYAVFPDFKICDAVTISASAPIPNVDKNPFTPKDNTTVTVPVK
ncbi:MAG: hypothetical protein ACO295_08300 [Sediminibacterium sp.]|jgi:hypothetical protein